MRTTKELLEIMLQNIIVFKYGLCYMASCIRRRGLINDSEYLFLLGYIGNNRPSKYSSIGAYLSTDSNYYWPKGWKRPRVRWLKHHIKKQLKNPQQ